MRDHQEEDRGSLGRLPRGLAWALIGLLIGLGAGLLLGWVVWPLEFSDADPSVLEEEIQQDYAVMIAGGYWLDDDLAQARRRLRSLDKVDLDGWLLSVTVGHILQGGDELEARQLARLANDLGLESPVMDPYLPAEGGGDESPGVGP